MVLSIADRTQFALEYLKLSLQLSAPFDTGNLMLNSIRIDLNNDCILIGGEIAPYAAATNEQWVSDKWNGKTNPNEGWIQEGIENAKQGIFNIFSGVYSKNDIEAFAQVGQSQLNAKIQNRIQDIESEG